MHGFQRDILIDRNHSLTADESDELSALSSAISSAILRDALRRLTLPLELSSNSQNATFVKDWVPAVYWTNLLVEDALLGLPLAAELLACVYCKDAECKPLQEV